MRTIERCAVAIVGLALCASALVAHADKDNKKPKPKNVEAPMTALKLESSAFQPQAEIPRKYTCEGDDSSPPLGWSGVPEGTKTLALIVDDPDAPDPAAPKRTWVHWVVFNIPAVAVVLPEGGKPLPAGALQGLNDWKKASYGGPCPPIGRHRY